MSAQADGDYAEALILQLELEDDPLIVATFLYNIALIHASNGEHEKALLL